MCKFEKCFVSASFVLYSKSKSPETRRVKGDFEYPDPGSNRDGLLHRCLRPARLPIPPSGLIGATKVVFFFGRHK